MLRGVRPLMVAIIIMVVAIPPGRARRTWRRSRPRAARRRRRWSIDGPWHRPDFYRSAQEKALSSLRPRNELCFFKDGVRLVPSRRGR